MPARESSVKRGATSGPSCGPSAAWRRVAASCASAFIWAAASGSPWAQSHQGHRTKHMYGLAASPREHPPSFMRHTIEAITWAARRKMLLVSNACCLNRIRGWPGSVMGPVQRRQCPPRAHDASRHSALQYTSPQPCAQGTTPARALGHVGIAGRATAMGASRTLMRVWRRVRSSICTSRVATNDMQWPQASERPRFSLFWIAQEEQLARAHVLGGHQATPPVPP
mmetsp:Transcript_1036/g.4023  ORF Transcript_1036/g.4023 Transcript_1036/m.4023 type:complete len:225 (+) Transcript_1036:199-873(+)